jgi:hypothetical protein
MNRDSVRSIFRRLLVVLCAATWAVAGFDVFDDHAPRNRFLKRTERLPFTFPLAEATSQVLRESPIPSSTMYLIVAAGSCALLHRAWQHPLSAPHNHATWLGATVGAFAFPTTYIATMILAARAIDGC